MKVVNGGGSNLDSPQAKAAREVGINSFAVMLRNICRWAKVNYSRLIDLANLHSTCQQSLSFFPYVHFPHRRSLR
jgi:hypothetical protein